ncbi:MAG: sulfotransferase, partial [Planctomycetota bacterium]
MSDADALERGLFFIVGTGRCGTTLLQAMLMSHPRLTIPPETWFFCAWDPAMHGGDPLPDNIVTERYLSTLFGSVQWPELQLDEAGFAEAVRAGDRSTRSIFLELLRRWSDRTGKPRAGEKTPLHLKHTGRILEAFPHARFIHIYRDPRDVALSMLEHRWSPLRLHRYARSWVKAMHRHRRLAEALGPEVYTGVRFEDLVTNPEPELRRLCSFLGEPFDDAMLHPERRSERGFSSRESDWKELTMSPVTTARIGRYRGKLSPRRVRTVERVVGPVLSEMGYQPDDGPP